MANIRITDKQTVTPTGSDFMLINQAGSDKNTTLARLKTYMNGSTALETEAQDTNSAINEVNTKATNASTGLNGIKNTIGSGTLETTSQNIIGGLNEVNNKVGNEKLETIAENCTGGINELKEGVDNLTESVTQNTASLNAKANALTTVDHTTENINYYVAPNGNNTNDGLTADTPVQTIQTIINRLPKNIRHSITINLAEGTYSENLLISGFFGNGAIQIIGGNSVTEATNYLLNSISITKNTLPITITGIELTTTTQSSAIIQYVNGVSFQYCVISNTASQRGFSFSYAIATINNCIINNRNPAVYSSENSTVQINNCEGSGNVCCYQARYNSTIGLYNNAITGDTESTSSRGGEVRA